MFIRLSLLIVFLSFGWIGASQLSPQTLTEDDIQALFNNAEKGLPAKQPESLPELLVQLGFNYYVPTSKEFHTDAKTMVQTISSYCEQLNTANLDTYKSEPILSAQTAAENAWLKTMGTYHKILAAPLGPIYESTREIASAIYSWPLMNECGMHVEMLAVKNQGQFNPKSLYTSKGLMAVEFGLFKDLETTTCNTRNKSFAKVHEWIKIDDFTKTKDLCGLAKAAAEDVVVQGQRLAEAWDLEGRNFTRQIINGSEFESFKYALNRITDSMFTMIEVAKDVQLGKPLGLHKDCLDESGKCPADVEHKWSQTSIEGLIKQFESLEFILNQGGLGAFISAQGFPSISQSLQFEIQVLLQQLAEVQKLGSLQEQVMNLNPEDCENTTVSNNLVPICAVQRQTRVLVHILRSEMLPALVLDAPLVYQGDND